MAEETSITTKTESPLYDNKTFKWYLGDTFELTFLITFKNTSGTVIDNLNFNAENGDYLVFEFYDKKKSEVATYEFGYNHYQPTTEGTGSSTKYKFVLNFNESFSAKFIVGSYSFCANYKKDNEMTTIIGRGAIEVEACH